MADRFFVGSAGFDSGFSSGFASPSVALLWDDISNWSLVSGGAGGASVPIAGDKAIFDDNSPSCDLDISPTVDELLLEGGGSAFPNTLDFSGFNLTVDTLAEIKAGTLTGGAGNFIVGAAATDELILSGGTLNAPDGTLDVQKLTITGGTYNAGIGLTLKRRGDMTLSVAVSFNDFELNTAGANLVFDITGGSWDVAGDFTLTNAHGVTMTPSGTAMTLAGDWHGDDAYIPVGGTNWIVEFDGGGVQDVDGGQDIPSVKINKAAGVLNFTSDITVRGSSWEWVQGTVDCLTFGTTVFFAATDVDSSGMVFCDVTIDTGANFVLLSDMFIDGALFTIVNANTFQGAGDIHCRGAVVETQETGLFSSPNSFLIFDGVGAQTLRSDNPAAIRHLPGLRINKAAGTLTIEDYLGVQVGLIYDAGAVTADPASILNLRSAPWTMNAAGLVLNDFELQVGNSVNTGTLVVGGDFTLITGAQVDGGTIEVRGDLTANDAAVTGTTTVTVTGTGTQNLDVDDLPNGGLTISKFTGEAVLIAPFVMAGAGNVAVALGTLNLDGFDITLPGTLDVDDTLQRDGSETVTIAAWDIDPATSTIELIDSAVTADMSFLAGDTIFNLVFGDDKTHEFATGAGNELRVNGMLQSRGSLSTPSVLRSAVPGTQWFLNLQGVSLLNNKVDVQDSDANAGILVEAVGSVDMGNNENWDFGGPVFGAVQAHGQVDTLMPLGGNALGSFHAGGMLNYHGPINGGGAGGFGPGPVPGLGPITDLILGGDL